MSKTKGLSYIDTIQRYCAPRIVNVLGLPGNSISTESLRKENFTLSAYPNPTEGDFSLRVDAANNIRSIRVYDIIGKEVRAIDDVNATEYTVTRDGLTSGIYFVKVRTDKGEATRKMNLK